MDTTANIIMSPEEKETLRKLLEEQEGVSISVYEGIRELWYRNEDRQSELMLLFLFNYKVTVYRVCFIHRRQGTMTKVLSVLEGYCKKNKVEQLLVQSVETPEMANWCMKMGFTPDPNATILFDGFLMGDYKKQMI